MHLEEIVTVILTTMDKTEGHRIFAIISLTSIHDYKFFSNKLIIYERRISVKNIVKIGIALDY